MFPLESSAMAVPANKWGQNRSIKAETNTNQAKITEGWGLQWNQKHDSAIK